MGHKVICKHKNCRYYYSEVVELTTATFYEVVFDDGSYSDNLFPEDIEVSTGTVQSTSPDGYPFPRFHSKGRAVMMFLFLILYLFTQQYRVTT